VSASQTTPQRKTPNKFPPSDPIPKEPYRLTNLYVHPPLAILFAGYGDSISRAAADVCLYLAIDESLNTTTHTPLTPIDVKDLYYTSARLSLSFHTMELSTMTWNEWYNAALMVLRFVDMFDTREFMFTVGALDGGVWVVVGTGSLVSF
jgi:hypothetical protein